MDRSCSVCGSPIPADAPGGHCPRCLLESGAAPELRPNPRFEIPSRADLARSFPGYSRFELIREGGMGIVFSALQDKLGRKVAIKILPRTPESAEDGLAAEARFEREARALASMSHPNILTLFDYGTADGWHYLVTEFVDGLNLRHWWKAVRLAPTFDIHQVLGPIRQVAEALTYAHQLGVIHRDIKPENILVGTDGRVRVADFGLVKQIRTDETGLRLTETGERLGTPHYMAPEQVDGNRTVDARCDLFALGVVLYEALTGELPLGSFEPPSRKSRCDARLDLLVARALQRDVEKRIASASEFTSRVLEVETNRYPQRLREKSEAVSEEHRSRLRSGLALMGTGLFVSAFLPWVSWEPLLGGVLALNATSLSYPGPIWIPCALPGGFGALIVATTILEAAEWIRPRWGWFSLGLILNALLIVATWWKIETAETQNHVDLNPGFGLFASLLLLVGTYLLLPSSKR